MSNLQHEHHKELEEYNKRRREDKAATVIVLK